MRRIGLPLFALLAALFVAAPASAAITFTSKSVNTGNTPQGIVADFFHGGGNADLLTANSGDSNINLLLGDGGGNFANAAGSPFGARAAHGRSRRPTSTATTRPTRSRSA